MIELIVYETVHGPVTPTVGGVINPQVCGNLDPIKEMHTLAGKLGALKYDIVSDNHNNPQGDLFPRPTLEYRI